MLTWLFGWIWGGLQWLLTPFRCPPLLYKLPKPPQGPSHSAVHTAVFNPQTQICFVFSAPQHTVHPGADLGWLQHCSRVRWHHGFLLSTEGLSRGYNSHHLPAICSWFPPLVPICLWAGAMLAPRRQQSISQVRRGGLMLTSSIREDLRTAKEAHIKIPLSFQ